MRSVVASLFIADAASAAFVGGVARPAPGRSDVRARRVTMDEADVLDFGLAPGQIYGPTNPAHAWEK